MSYLGTSKIGKIFLGSTEIAKAYLGTSLVFQKGGSVYNRLPEGYRELVYVKTDSDAWIDTGIAGTTDLEITTRFMAESYVQYAAVYGNYIDDSHYTNRIILYSQTSLLASGGANVSQAVNKFSIGDMFTSTVTSSNVVLNGVTTAIAPVTKTSNTNNICLGNRCIDNPITRDIGLRIYSFVVHKSGTLVMELIPAKRESDDAIGFYDLVSETFMKSLTGTEFTAGPVATTPYIRNYNGAYINTGITPDETTRVTIWARNWNVSPETNALFGYLGSNNDNSFGLALWRSGSSGRIGVYFGDYGSPYTSASDVLTLLSGYHKYDLDRGVLKIDNTVMVTAPSMTFSTDGVIHLFGINIAGTRMDPSLPIDIRACKIYKNDVLVRDFTPVESPVLGFYDSVSETVFTNSGTGSLVYGTFNSNEYTRLQYIATGSGGSYFITKAIGSYNLKVSATIMATSSNANWFYPLGGRDATNRFEIFTGNTTISNARLYGIIGTSSANVIYGSDTAGFVRNKKFTVHGYHDAFRAYYNDEQVGSTISYGVSSSYTTNAPISIGACWRKDTSAFSSPFVGRLYHVLLGDYNFVPATVNNVAGMYETYNDVFYPSVSGNNFTAGSLA